MEKKILKSQFTIKKTHLGDKYEKEENVISQVLEELQIKNRVS